jgi:hypothetical protein
MMCAVTLEKYCRKAIPAPLQKQSQPREICRNDADRAANPVLSRPFYRRMLAQ